MKFLGKRKGRFIIGVFIALVLTLSAGMFPSHQDDIEGFRDHVAWLFLFLEDDVVFE